MVYKIHNPFGLIIISYVLYVVIPAGFILPLLTHILSPKFQDLYILKLIFLYPKTQ
ncbi:hypothetical protein T190607A01A_30098 [Tenacibaculum sp. 190524A05c]|uniref:Uncharacterized protein n=1 Tax=Tenacibaculum platacis TaxID=3137852 RepID=A0ABM9P2D4_9FLAO